MDKKAAIFKVKEPRWSKAISRTKWILGSFVDQWREYGFSIAWSGLLWWMGIYARKPSLSAKALKNLTTCIDKYFESKYADIISKYRNATDNNRGTTKKRIPTSEYPIWLFWWQGEVAMPDLVRTCYKYICMNNGNVTLLTKDNIEQYVHIPDIVYKKVAKGSISYTHFSDILRLTLLAERGGMWVDATCFNPYAIPDNAKQMLFCSPHDTLKQRELTDVVYWCDSGGWRSWNIGTCETHTPLFLFCRDMIQAIAVNQKCMPHYFMVDCLIQYAYRKIPEIRDIIDSMPDCNTKCSDLFLLYFNKNKPYDEEEYQQLIKNDWLFKLTYKTIWRETVNGKETFYGKLFKNK